MRFIQALRTSVFACVLLIVTTNAGAAQQTATLTGRITDSGNGEPVVGAQVMIAGSTVGTLTNRNGAFTLRALTPGTVNVRVLSIGYAELTRQVTLTAGQTANADFSLRQVAIDVPPVVATATGEQRREEL